MDCVIFGGHRGHHIVRGHEMRYVLACLKVRRKGLCSRIAIMEARFRNMKKEMKKHLRMSGSLVKEEEEE